MNDARILVVEDDPGDLALILRVLDPVVDREATLVATSGGEALDYLLARGAHAQRDDRAQPDLVILDLRLPDMDGFEVLREARASPRARYVPFVVLSGNDDPAACAESYRLGANSFLAKPVEPMGFAELVRRAGHYWLSVNRPVPVIRAGYLR
jgi:two-component system response regulator